MDILKWKLNNKDFEILIYDNSFDVERPPSIRIRVSYRIGVGHHCEQTISSYEINENVRTDYLINMLDHMRDRCIQRKKEYDKTGRCE